MLAAFRWIVPGRLAASGQPGLLDTVDADLQFLEQQQIRTIVNLTEQQVVPPAQYPGFRWLHFPVEDMRTPTPRDCEKICRTIVDSMDAGEPVVIHCRAGLGRTGTIAACCLVTLGYEPAEALAEVRRSNSRSVQTSSQERFIGHYADFLKGDTSAASLERKRRATDLVKPDLQFFASIGGEGGLTRVLTAFYDRIFEDPRLGHFFRQTHKETIRAKQIAFMKRCFTGETAEYMGQRPRNAHHWMVISEEDFDYREELMREVLEAAGFTPEQVERWLAVENAFRRQIVKDKPWPLFYRGVQTCWAEQAREERTELATVCDTCQAEIDVGQSLWILGDQTLCRGCLDQRSGKNPSATV